MCHSRNSSPAWPTPLWNSGVVWTSQQPLGIILCPLECQFIMLTLIKCWNMLQPWHHFKFACVAERDPVTGSKIHHRTGRSTYTNASVSRGSQFTVDSSRHVPQFLEIRKVKLAVGKRFSQLCAFRRLQQLEWNLEHGTSKDSSYKVGYICLQLSTSCFWFLTTEVQVHVCSNPL